MPRPVTDRTWQELVQLWDALDAEGGGALRIPRWALTEEQAQREGRRVARILLLLREDLPLRERRW